MICSYCDEQWDKQHDELEMCPVQIEDEDEAAGQENPVLQAGESEDSPDQDERKEWL